MINAIVVAYDVIIFLSIATLRTVGSGTSTFKIPLTYDFGQPTILLARLLTQTRAAGFRGFGVKGIGLSV